MSGAIKSGERINLCKVSTAKAKPPSTEVSFFFFFLELSNTESLKQLERRKMVCFCSIQFPPFAKSLTLLSPISTLSSLSLRPIRSNFSPPPASSLPSPFLCRCTSTASPPSHSDGFIVFLDEDKEEAAAVGEEKEEEDEEEFYEDDDLDLEALESEAKDAVRSYSTSLSRQLTIGNLPLVTLFFSPFLISLFFIVPNL